MKKKIGVVGQVVEKLGFIFGDGAKCQLGFYESKKSEIVKEQRTNKSEV